MQWCSTDKRSCNWGAILTSKSNSSEKEKLKLYLDHIIFIHVKNMLVVFFPKTMFVASNVEILYKAISNLRSPLNRSPTLDSDTWLWPIQEWTQDLWGCPVLSGTRALMSSGLRGGHSIDLGLVLALHTDAQSDLDLGNWEARPVPWAFCQVVFGIPEQFLWCVRMHCSAVGGH